jgi:hypothetical protein
MCLPLEEKIPFTQNTMLKQLPVIYNLTLHKNSRHGYSVPGITLLQILLFTYSLLEVITITAGSLKSYTLNPVVLPQVETFMELLFRDNLQCCHHRPLNVFSVPKSSFLHAGYSLWKEQKSLGAREGRGAYSSPLMVFCAAWSGGQRVPSNLTHHDKAIKFWAHI